VSLVVSDTTPLNYLILIGHVEVLPRLFGTLLVPPAVIQEMHHPKTPPEVAAWARHLPSWLEVKAPHTDLHVGIGAGEDEAIALAVELGNATVLMVIIYFRNQTLLNTVLDGVCTHARHAPLAFRARRDAGAKPFGILPMDAVETANANTLQAIFPAVGRMTARPSVPKELLGAVILFIGSEAEQKGEPQLIIDYRTARGREKRIVLQFTELGMWIESVGLRPAPNRDGGQR